MEKSRSKIREKRTILSINSLPGVHDTGEVVMQEVQDKRIYSKYKMSQKLCNLIIKICRINMLTKHYMTVGILMCKCNILFHQLLL